MQISEGYSAKLRTIFEEFLKKWVYLKEESNVLPKAELQSSSFEGCQWQSVIPVEKYLKVAEVYAITILGMILHKPDVAISWTEKAGLPEEKRQVRYPICLVQLVSWILVWSIYRACFI